MTSNSGDCRRVASTSVTCKAFLLSPKSSKAIFRRRCGDSSCAANVRQRNSPDESNTAHTKKTKRRVECLLKHRHLPDIQLSIPAAASRCDKGHRQPVLLPPENKPGRVHILVVARALPDSLR